MRNLSELRGVKTLNKNEQKRINGGQLECPEQCTCEHGNIGGGAECHRLLDELKELGWDGN